MNTRLIVALACGAALALGACSGTPTPTAPDPAEPEPTDDRTPEQKAFDDALEKAKIALAEARQKVAAAAKAATDAAEADTYEARSAALAEILSAQDALTDAVAASRALAALVPDGDFDRLGLAGFQTDAALNAQAEDLAKLRAALAAIGWSSSIALERRAIPRTVVGVIRTERIRNGKDVPTRLKSADLPAVMYEAGTGQVVVADGLIGGGSGTLGIGDRFRMRGFPSRLVDSNGALDDNNGDPITTATNAYFDEFLAGLTITPLGLVIDLGGGRSLGTDMRLDVDTEIAASTDNAYDLTLTFGWPESSPTGNSEHYWAAALMPTDDQVAADPALLTDGPQTLPIGVYHLRLSNHVGVDTNLEDPDEPPFTRDDDNSYLTYAAYGLFDFVPTSTVTGNTAGNPRIFPFHVGYDAFKDEADMRVTDVADADKITSGKFKGLTIAEELVLESTSTRLRPPGAVGGGLMLRGDIELTATISGTAADNTISGTIMNLESWDAKGYWEDYSWFTEIRLEQGDIEADGSFDGDTADPDVVDNFGVGFYQGNFYGPLSDLEAAGTWYVAGVFAPGDLTGTRRALMGSFGAALVRDDGTYGNVLYGEEVYPTGD